MNIDEMIEVLQASKDGKKIQRLARDGCWHYHPCQLFDFIGTRYRIKPPEPREFWLCNGQDRKLWVVVEPDHPTNVCNGDKIKVREVIE